MGDLPVRRLPHTLLADRFRLLSPLDHGGMGELWSAEHVGLGSPVVIKFISAELSGRPDAAERFAREAAAAARVNSPHVVKVIDYGASDDGAPFLVMEKLEGRDLAAEIAARGPLPVAEVARIVRQLSQGLAKAHAAGVVHRDVKPSNVFLCEGSGDLFVKLLDFGIAKMTETSAAGLTASGTGIGTPGYMSPEQLLGARDVDLRTDVWSLGVLGFHCLTGAKPFDGVTAGAIALAIHTLPLPRPSVRRPSLPPAVDAWFARACARNVADRFATAQELALALGEALEVTAEVTALGLEEDSTPVVAMHTLTGSIASIAPRARPPRARAPFVAAAALLALAAGATTASRLARGPGAGLAAASSKVEDVPAARPFERDDLESPLASFALTTSANAATTDAAPVALSRSAKQGSALHPPRAAQFLHARSAPAEAAAPTVAAAPVAEAQASIFAMPSVRRSREVTSAEVAPAGSDATPDARR